MVTSVANVTGGIASLLLSALVLCFDVPRFVAPDGWMNFASASRAFHATATIEDAGHGEKRLTVRLDFNPGDRDENEGL